MAGYENYAVAKEVIAGKWGDGNERKAKLEKAGYNYNTIQSLVNELLLGVNTNDDFKSTFNKCLAAIENLPEFKKLSKLL